MFDLAAVRALLGGTRFTHLRLVEETGSTNDDALPLLADDAPTPKSIVAEFQHHGKGRHGRVWLAEPGTSLLWTTVLPPIASDALWAIPFWVSLCLAEGIAEATDVHVQLQWPNDILLDGRKLGGILCVSRINGRFARVGCGVGLNIVRPARTLALEQPAAFLADYAATTREQVLACCLAAFDAHLGDLETPEQIARTWEYRARLAGTPYHVLVDGSDTPFTGLAKRLDNDGSLVITHEGKDRHISLGDARVIRDTP